MYAITLMWTFKWNWVSKFAGAVPLVRCSAAGCSVVPTQDRCHFFLFFSLPPATRLRCFFSFFPLYYCFFGKMRAPRDGDPQMRRVWDAILKTAGKIEFSTVRLNMLWLLFIWNKLDSKDEHVRRKEGQQFNMYSLDGIKIAGNTNFLGIEFFRNWIF